LGFLTSLTSQSVPAKSNKLHPPVEKIRSSLIAMFIQGFYFGKKDQILFYSDGYFIRFARTCMQIQEYEDCFLSYPALFMFFKVLMFLKLSVSDRQSSAG
jgi:hypothetical protein